MALVEGLYIQDRWDWKITYPVIKIDFADGKLQNRAELDESKIIEQPEIDHNPALEQIRAKEYAEKYLGTHGTHAHKIDLIFSKVARNRFKYDTKTR